MMTRSAMARFTAVGAAVLALGVALWLVKYERLY